MRYLITDEELYAYANGDMSTQEMHELEKKAANTHQLDLLLAASMANYAIQKEEAEALWGKDEIEVFDESTSAGRIAACVEIKPSKKNKKN